MAAGPPRYNEPLASSGEKKLDDDGLLRVATIRNNACIPAAEQGRRRKVERSESGVARERRRRTRPFFRAATLVARAAAFSERGGRPGRQGLMDAIKRLVSKRTAGRARGNVAG